MSESAMDETVRVRLTDEELLERGRTLSAKVLHIDVLRKKKAEDAKSTQALIDADLDEVARLARVIAEDEEDRKQGDLKFADEIPAEQAKQALAEVAARAEADLVEAPPTFVCAWCVSDGKSTKRATKKRRDGLFRDDEGRDVCPACQAAAEKEGIWGPAGSGVVVPVPAETPVPVENALEAEGEALQGEADARVAAVDELAADLDEHDVIPGASVYAPGEDKIQEDDEPVVEGLDPFGGEGVARQSEEVDEGLEPADVIDRSRADNVRGAAGKGRAH